MKADPRVLRYCAVIKDAAAGFVALSGLIVLIGWIFDVHILKALLYSSVTMKANTAVCLILTGLALWLATRPPAWKRARAIGWVLAITIIALAAATLSEHVIGWDLGIDLALFIEPPGSAATASPGRMGPPASTALTLAGLALLVIDWRTPRDRVPSQYLAIAISLIALLSLIGYAYDIHALFNLPQWTGIAAHTSLALAVLALGILCAQPAHGLMAVVTSEGAGGMLARRLLLPVLTIPFALGWLRGLMHHHGIVDDSFGRPAFILLLIILLTWLIWWNARVLAQMDAERELAAKDARKSEARFRRVSECGMIGIVFSDVGGKIHEANNAYLRILDATREELFGGTVDWRKMTPPEQLARDEKAVAELLSTGIASPYEKEYIRRDGTRVPVLLGAAFLEGSKTETVAFVLDLSELRRAEDLARQQRDEILHLARVTSVGEMAAGLAHELNQPLGAILNYAGAALENSSSTAVMSPQLTETLEDIAAESKRAGEILRRMRDFVRKQQPRVAPIQLNALIAESMGLLASELRRAGVRWSLELDENLPAALADGLQIEQVLVNLIRNAIDAMEDVAEAQRQIAVRSYKNGAALYIEVIDPGCGAPQKVLDAMFDAFFTTKSDGMGMGLAICRSIIEAHNGHVFASPNSSAGLTVGFSLPIAAGNSAS